MLYIDESCFFNWIITTSYPAHVQIYPPINVLPSLSRLMKVNPAKLLLKNKWLLVLFNIKVYSITG